MTFSEEKTPITATPFPFQRRSERVPLEAVIHYQIDGKDFVNLSTDISSEGIFIKNISPPVVGTSIMIQVNLSEDLRSVPIKMVGKVVRTVDAETAENKGMGIEFQSIYADNPEAINHFVYQVFGVERFGMVTLEEDTESGSYIYKPGPNDSLRILKADKQGRLHPSLIRRFFRPSLKYSLMMVLIGCLIGGGLVSLFFLFD